MLLSLYAPPRFNAVYSKVFELEDAAGSPMSSADKALYERAIRSPDAVRGGLSYYRASACGLWEGQLPSWVPGSALAALRWIHGVRAVPEERRGDAVIEVPVMVLWGVRDRYLGKELATPPADLVPGLEGPIFIEASHWVHLSSPDIVNSQILRFLKKGT